LVVMNLWCSVHFLFAGLYLSSSAPTPEECHRLVEPVSLSEPSTMFGKFNIIMGYVDKEVVNNMMKIMESSWVKFAASPSDQYGFVISQMNKMNGSCIAATANVTVQGDKGTVSVANITSSFVMLESCKGCLVLSMNSTSRHMDKVLRQLSIDAPVGEEELNYRSLYLMSGESSLPESDLEHFKQQAGCLGFAGEPGFHHDPEKDFCREDDVVKVSFQ